VAAKIAQRGGSFLLEDVPIEEIFTPEDFGDEHLLILNTVDRFMKNEVEPNLERIEQKDWDLTRQLMLKAGELGLLGVDIEEKYGGSHIGIIASSIIAERVAQAGSFGLTLNGHTGIGSLPLAYFGNKAQKEKYLAALTSGEKLGAYALTEPGTGTDALSLKTSAKLSPDGKYYILDGTKQFITNGTFSDIVFTYAKVDGTKMTAFIVEKGFEGVSTGPEEKKMGLRGSSTCTIFLDNAKVPVENVLFEIGRGHIVAFNILNLGRFKLGAASVGAAKLAMERSVGYSKERVQFNRPICQFGMIKHKIAEMAAKTYMAESMLYRTCGLIDTIFATIDHAAEDIGRQTANCIAEYAIECSINKVYGSEIIAYVADEAIQILGGYGYIEDYIVERIYRDNRILRIFEGTNEINRVIILNFLLRKSMKNEIPLLSEAEKTKGELKTMKPIAPSPDDDPLGYQVKLVSRAKKIFLYLCHSAVQKYGTALEEEEEVLGWLADMVQEIFAMDSGLLRALKSVQSRGEKQSKTKINMVQLYVNEAMFRIADYARQITTAMETGSAQERQLTTLGKALKFVPLNTVQLRREIANDMIEVGKYTC
jgi:alkylation response protein AidB-like acyl-CoA dehydrogenase